VVIRQFLAARLIDYLLGSSLIPVVLGGGIRRFECGISEQSLVLERVET